MDKRISRRQKGLSLIGMLVVGVVLALAALLGFKATPAWVEYWGVKKAVASMANAGELQKSPADIRAAFDRHAVTGYIDSITGRDLQIAKASNGYNVSFAYRKEIPVAGNMSIVFDFSGGSASGGRKRVE